MSVKEVFTRLTDTLEKYEKPLGVGFAIGVATTLGISLLVPDTARTFVEEARTRLLRRKPHEHHHHHDRDDASNHADKLAQESPATALQR